MNYYEYDFVTLDLSEDQKQVIQMNLGNTDHLIILVKDAINLKTKDGWEPLYPFSIPHIWFRKLKSKRTKK